MIDSLITGTAHVPDLACEELLAPGQLLRARDYEAPRRPRRGLAEWQVRRVTGHIRAHLDRPISLAELAALVGLSRFHFCTAFRLATGWTPRDWLTDQRIRRAAVLLEDQRLSITEVALEVGYETPSSFTARFRKRMGITPSEYRRAL